MLKSHPPYYWLGGASVASPTCEAGIDFAVASLDPESFRLRFKYVSALLEGYGHKENLAGTTVRIRVTTVYVDDQEKALRFYTKVLGFAKKTDFSNGPYRWLTVTSPEDPDGIELQLALNDNPAAKAYQQAIFQQGQPAVMFFTDDVKGDYEQIRARGAEFTMPPTEVTGSTIAKLKDTCGNLLQISQLARY